MWVIVLCTRGNDEKETQHTQHTYHAALSQYTRHSKNAACALFARALRCNFLRSARCCRWSNQHRSSGVRKYAQAIFFNNNHCGLCVGLCVCGIVCMWDCVYVGLCECRIVYVRCIEASTQVIVLSTPCVTCKPLVSYRYAQSKHYGRQAL